MVHQAAGKPDTNEALAKYITGRDEFGIPKLVICRRSFADTQSASEEIRQKNIWRKIKAELEFALKHDGEALRANSKQLIFLRTWILRCVQYDVRALTVSYESTNTVADEIASIKKRLDFTQQCLRDT